MNETVTPPIIMPPPPSDGADPRPIRLPPATPMMASPLAPPSITPPPVITPAPPPVPPPIVVAPVVMAPAPPPPAAPAPRLAERLHMPESTPVAPPPPSAAPAFARVYDHLVEGDDDLVGLIAYGLYKQDKRDWIQRWVRQHNRQPTDDQIEAFVNGQMTPGQRDRYRTAARQVMDAYAGVALDIEKPGVVREALAGRVEEAADRIEGTNRWWKQIPAAFFGALLFVVVFIAVLYGLDAAGVDFLGLIGFDNVTRVDAVATP